MGYNPQTNKPVGLIAIMGATGSGKSSFTNDIIGEPVAVVGSGLESLTTEVSQYARALDNGLDLHIVDTPGFNDYRADGKKSDLKILQSIAAFLKSMYDANQKFSGVIFLHSINAGTFNWQAQRRNIALFKKLWGTESMKNVVVVTTFWDQLPSIADGTQKECALQTESGLLKDLFDGGAKFVRSGHFKTQPEGDEFWSCHRIVDHLLSLHPVFAQMQKEIGEGKEAADTSAGAMLHEFKKLRRDTLKSLGDMTLRLDTISSASIENRSHQDELNRKYERDATHWGEYIREAVTKDYMDSVMALERKEIAGLRLEVTQLREVLEQQQALMQQSVRELTIFLNDARRDRDLHLAQSQGVSLELAEVRRAAESEKVRFQGEIGSLRSVLEHTQMELKEERTLREDEASGRKIYQTQVKELQRSLEPSNPPTLPLTPPAESSSKEYHRAAVPPLTITPPVPFAPSGAPSTAAVLFPALAQPTSPSTALACSASSPQGQSPLTSRVRKSVQSGTHRTSKLSLSARTEALQAAKTTKPAPGRQWRY